MTNIAVGGGGAWPQSYTPPIAVPSVSNSNPLEMAPHGHPVVTPTQTPAPSNGTVAMAGQNEPQGSGTDSKGYEAPREGLLKPGEADISIWSTDTGKLIGVVPPGSTPDSNGNLPVVNGNNKVGEYGSNGFTPTQRVGTALPDGTAMAWGKKEALAGNEKPAGTDASGNPVYVAPGLEKGRPGVFNGDGALVGVAGDPDSQGNQPVILGGKKNGTLSPKGEYTPEGRASGRSRGANSGESKHPDSDWTGVRSIDDTAATVAQDVLSVNHAVASNLHVPEWAAAALVGVGVGAALTMAAPAFLGGLVAP